MEMSGSTPVSPPLMPVRTPFLLCLLLFVCGTAHAADAPSPSAAPTGYDALAATHLESDPRETPPPLLAGDVLDIDDGGIGPFRLGMGPDEVVALAGKPRSLGTFPDTEGRHVLVLARGRSSFTFSEGRLVRVALGTGDFPRLRVRGQVIGHDVRPDNAVEKLGADAITGPGGRTVLPLGAGAILGFNPSSRRQPGDAGEVYFVDLRDRAHYGVTDEKLAETRERAAARTTATVPPLLRRPAGGGHGTLQGASTEP